MNLIEGEGLGYDLVCEKLGRDAKPLLEIESNINKMSLTVYSGMVEDIALAILDRIDRHLIPDKTLIDAQMNGTDSLLQQLK